MMDIHTIKTLAATPPPPRRILSHREVASRIQALESAVAGNITRPPTEPQSEARPATPNQSDTTRAQLRAEYERIEHPADKVAYYRRHKQEIDAAYRDTPEPRSTAKPTGNALVDEMNAIEDAASRVKFYRLHKSEIDRWYAAQR